MYSQTKAFVADHRIVFDPAWGAARPFRGRIPFLATRPASLLRSTP